ncbi:MAG: hypothetical protein ABEJ05_05400 [Haloglomus sp.]
MIKENFEQEWGMKRRNVLRGAAVVGAAGAFGLPAFSGSVAASSHITETIYLSHSVDSENVTKLFSVDLDSTAGEAVLTEVTSIGGDFQNVDAIAATPDGGTVMFIDRNTAHLGEYDVSADSFTDRGAITGLPTITVLAAYGLDENLYAASNTTNKLYTVDYSVSPPVANEVGTITGATVNGADIVVDSTGTMFLHTNNNDTLYTIDYQNPVNGEVAATVVGQADGSSLTGLAVRAAGTGDFVGSSRADDAIVVLDKTDGSRTATLDMTLNGNAYSYTNGDMATGTIIDETCEECTSDELLAKYEFACTEEVDGECVDYDFVLEEGDSRLVSYEPGSFESKEDEAFEPVSATFGTDYCTVYAVVKAGQELAVQELVADDGEVVAENIGKYAISFVAFYCTEAAAQDAANAFP